jgi:hypothetical protein
LPIENRGRDRDRDREIGILGQEKEKETERYLKFKLMLLRVLKRNVIFGKTSFPLPILQQDESNLFPHQKQKKKHRVVHQQ